MYSVKIIFDNIITFEIRKDNTPIMRVNEAEKAEKIIKELCTPRKRPKMIF